MVTLLDSLMCILTMCGAFRFDTQLDYIRCASYYVTPHSVCTRSFCIQWVAITN